MIEIRHLIDESGANKFGTCNCCGKSSSEDPLMISIKFSYYGHGTLICLCDDCKKKLMQVLLPANDSEIPNSSDTISRAKAIEALWEKRQALNDYMEILLQDGKMSSRYLTKIERNRIEEDINIIEELPPAQPINQDSIKTQSSDLISKQAAIEALTKDKKALEHIINGMSGYEKEFDRFVGQRNQVDSDIYEMEQLPPAQPTASDCWGCNCPKMERLAQPEPSQVAKDIARIVGNGEDMRVIAQGRIRGHWIPVGGALYQCDQCGVVSLKRKFCSECGADMREG